MVREKEREEEMGGEGIKETGRGGKREREKDSVCSCVSTCARVRVCRVT